MHQNILADITGKHGLNILLDNDDDSLRHDAGASLIERPSVSSAFQPFLLLNSGWNIRLTDFVGGDGPDVFTGGGGNDRAEGKGGDDTLSGGGGNDVLIGNGGADTLIGGTGDDILYAGDETPEFSFPFIGFPFTPPLLDTGTDIDILIGGAGDDRLFAGYGDTVDGGSNDYLGDKLYISFLGSTVGIAYNSGLATQTIGGGTISGIENVSWVEGSNYDDYIVIGAGDAYSELTVVSGMGGNDTLIAGYYTGSLFGGDGNDFLDGRNSQYMQIISGDAGNDTIYTPINGFAVAYGGDGNDIIFSNAETHGGNGNDRIFLQFSYYSGNVYGDAGNDIIVASDAGHQIFGGDGADRLTGGMGDDLLVSGNANADFAAAHDDGAEHDVITGGGGNDTIWAGYGDDVNGGAGWDALYLSFGGATEGVTFRTRPLVVNGSTIIGGGLIQNIETLIAVKGSDFDDRFVVETQSTLLTIDGGAGNDVVESGNSRVYFRGGEGNDWFISGSAADIFIGGAGIDTVQYRMEKAGATVTLGLEEGSIGTGGGDTLVSVERVDGTNYNDSITGSNSDNRLRGLGGDDMLNGLLGDDRLDGNAGNDSLYGGGGNDALFGGGGNDMLYGGDDGDRLNGGNGNDALYGEAGNDILRGGNGNDALDGGLGDDKLFGDAGNDMLTGGTGADIFYFRGAFGLDTITDFESGVDSINLAQLRGANGGDRLTLDQILITDTGIGTRIELDLDRDGIADAFDLDGDSIADNVWIDLVGVQAADVVASDFNF